MFLNLACHWGKRKAEKLGQHGETVQETVQLSRKYTNVKVDLPKTTRPNPIETEYVIFEHPFPEEKQEEAF